MSLKVWLPLNGNLENKGSNDITVTQDNSVLLNTPGKIGTCASSTSSSNNTITLNVTNLSTIIGRNIAYSVCCWAKFNNSTTNGYIYKLGSANVGGFWWTCTETKPRLTWNEAGTGKQFAGGELALDYINWHHYTFTVIKDDIDNAILAVYIDGELSNTYVLTVPNISSGDIITIYPYIASINDFRLYDHCLSAAEVKEISQGLVLHYKLDDITNVIQDSSGYNYNGTVIGNPILNSNTARYSACIAFNGTTDAINCGRAFEIQQAQAMTFCAWIYSDNWNNSTNKYYLSSQESGGFLLRSRDNNNLRARIHAYTASDLSTAGYIDADYAQSSANIGDSGWHHVAGVYTTSNLKLYIDGILRKTTSVTTYGAHFTSSTYLFLGAECAGSSPSTFCNCKLSDVRIYYTALSDNDILQLYNTSMKVDNLGNIHAYAFNESTTLTVNPTGIVNETSICELPILTLLKYDPNTYIEPDGSTWVRIFHHNNPVSKLFSSTNDFVNSVYLDEDRWFNVQVCNDLSTWELMVKEKELSTGNELKYRWTQAYNPMTATLANVSHANITPTTQSGYGTILSNYGGIYKNTTGNTYLSASKDNSSSKWWCSLGANKLNNGTTLPGYCDANISTGYLDVYVRIDNITSTQQTTAQFKKSGAILAPEFIEI